MIVITVMFIELGLISPSRAGKSISSLQGGKTRSTSVEANFWSFHLTNYCACEAFFFKAFLLLDPGQQTIMCDRRNKVGLCLPLGIQATLSSVCLDTSDNQAVMCSKGQKVESLHRTSVSAYLTELLYNSWTQIDDFWGA